MTYNEFLDSCKPDYSVIPESCDNFYISSLYLADAIQEAHNEIFRRVGLEELSTFEESYTEGVLLEAEDEKKKNEKTIAEWFKRIWSKIKGFFEGLIQKIKGLGEKIKRKYIENRVKNIDDAIKKGIEIYSKYPDAKEIPLGEYMYYDKNTNKFNDYSKTLQTKLEEMFNDIKNNKVDNDKYSSKDEVFKELTGCKDTEEFRKEFKDKGQKIVVTSKNVKQNITAAAGKRFLDQWLIEINDSYKETKKFITKAMKDVKAEVKKNKDAKINKFLLRTGTFVSILTKIVGVYSSEYRASYIALETIAMKCAAKAGKLAKNDGKLDEAADVSTKSTKVIDEAFAWLD